jgi:class 3 adenylate cyclase/ligand-binding sensor domain-containing protein
MIRPLFILFFALSLFYSLNAKEIRGGLPSFKNYHPSEYNGYSQNWVITSNSKGYIFVGNGDGILMFNGRSWSKFLLNNSATPSSLYCDENDIIWIGAQSEFGCLLPDNLYGYRYVSLTHLIYKKNREFGFIFSINKISDGIYFRASENIFRLLPQGVFYIPIERGSSTFEFNQVLFLYEPSYGFSVISGNKKLKVFSEVPPLMNIRKVIPLSNDSAIIADAKNGLYMAHFDFGNRYAIKMFLSHINTELNDYLTTNDLYHAIKLSNGNFGFSTSRSGTVVTDLDFVPLYYLTREAGIMNETHTFLYEDKQQNLWIAMDNGICKVSAQSPLSSYNDYQGIKGSVLDIVQSFGRIFIASWQGVFYQSLESGKYEREIFSPIKQILSQAWDLENVVLKNKNYLLAATSDGVFIIDSLLKTTRVAEGNFNYVKARNDNNELVYAGGAQTIKYLDFSNDILKPKVTQVPSLESRISNAVLSKNNELFVGTARDGVYVFSAVPLSDVSKNIVFEMNRIGTADGLPQSDSYTVFVFHDDILVSTQSGLFKIINKENKYLATPYDFEFMPYYDKSQFINIIREDSKGNMWFQTNSKLSGHKSLYYVIWKNNKKEFTSSQFQAFPDLEFYSITPLQDSVVWFGSDDGAFCFNWKVNNTFRFNDSFATSIQKVSVDESVIYSSISKNNLISKPDLFYFNKGNIRFDFAAGYFIHEKQVQFSYILEGYDDKWSNPSTENYKEYTNLPPGKYTFRVKAINPFGAVGTESEFSFVIPSPWYYKWWALLIFILLSGLLIVGIVTFFNRRLIKAKQRLENIVHSRTLEIQNQKKAIEIEKEKADKLLLNILPVRIANELKSTGKCQTEFYQSVTVLFTDISGFTSITELMDPEELVSKLDEIFTQFDDICSRNKLEKIKTIGDSHMSAGGIPVRNRTHAIDAALAAIEMQQYIQKLRLLNPANSIWKLRIGINSGEITAGVVGKRKFAFDIWGDTVNTASRLQDAGEPGKINISNNTAELISSFFDLTYRGKKPIKHKGEVDMFFVDGIKRELSIDGQMQRPNRAFWDKYNELLELKFLNF